LERGSGTPCVQVIRPIPPEFSPCDFVPVTGNSSGIATFAREMTDAPDPTPPEQATIPTAVRGGRGRGISVGH